MDEKIETLQRVVNEVYIKLASAFRAFDVCTLCDDSSGPVEEVTEPTVEAEPIRHGHWIDRADKIDAAYGRHHYQCNICARYLDGHVGGTEDWWDYEAPNYCPNCGAKMREVEE